MWSNICNMPLGKIKARRRISRTRTKSGKIVSMYGPNPDAPPLMIAAAFVMVKATPL